MVSWITTKYSDAGHGIRASKEFTQECISGLGHPRAVSDDNRSRACPVSKISALEDSNSKDSKLVEVKIDNAVKESACNLQRSCKLSGKHTMSTIM